ncbi:MAG: hypothetical protein WC777_03170 [Candidatus Gracilibacteria bacterium]|jgi:hypothetical protein
MKKKIVYLTGALGVLLVSAVAVASNPGMLQGKLSPITSCVQENLFDGVPDDSADFIAMLDGLSSATAPSICPIQIQANAYPVDSGYPMNVSLMCSSSELGVTHEPTVDTYEIECAQEFGSVEYAIRANLTLMEDGSYQLGANADTTGEHAHFVYTLDPETLLITRLPLDRY